MKLFRLSRTLLIPLTLLSLAGHANPPVIEESDEYVLAGDLQNATDANSVAKSVENNQADQSWQDNQADADSSQPLVKSQSTEAANADDVSVAEQLHSLQTEIQELRGQIEIQAHDLKMLQQQQLAFYKDLDARLQKHKGDETDSPSVSQSNVAPETQNKAHNPADEQISYLAAFDLIKNKQYDQALESMQRFIKQYPDSGYGANAHYWLGELYLVKKESGKALSSFNTVITQYPKSSKVADSQLKASYALIDLGRYDAARSKLQKLINQFPGTKTAALAKQKLENMN